MRFYDDLMASKAVDDHFKSMLSGATVISIDNVARYCFENKIEAFEIGHEIPTIAPPFDHFFMDVSESPKYLTVADDTRELPQRRFGVLFIPFDIEGLGVSFISSVLEKMFSAQTEFNMPENKLVNEPNKDLLIRTVKENLARWYVQHYLVTEESVSIDNKMTRCYSITMQHVLLKEDGTLADKYMRPLFYFTPTMHTGVKHIDAQLTDRFVNSLMLTGQIGNYVAMYTQPAYMAISMMHCKNTKIKEVDSKKVYGRQQCRAFERQMDRPPVIYKTIEIEPMGKKSNSSNSGTCEVSTMPLHICRGHFRTYTDENKLFGKLTGTFWIPQHAKGSLNNGQHVSDYKIKDI